MAETRTLERRLCDSLGLSVSSRSTRLQTVLLDAHASRSRARRPRLRRVDCAPGPARASATRRGPHPVLGRAVRTSRATRVAESNLCALRCPGSCARVACSDTRPRSPMASLRGGCRESGARARSGLPGATTSHGIPANAVLWPRSRLSRFPLLASARGRKSTACADLAVRGFHPM
jgi:hypothetical protein